MRKNTRNPYRRLAGYRASKRVYCGTIVIYDSFAFGLNPDPAGKWIIVLEPHGYLLTAATLREARSIMDDAATNLTDYYPLAALPDNVNDW